MLYHPLEWDNSCGNQKLAGLASSSERNTVPSKSQPVTSAKRSRHNATELGKKQQHAKETWPIPQKPAVSLSEETERNKPSPLSSISRLEAKALVYRGHT